MAWFIDDKTFATFTDLVKYLGNITMYYRTKYGSPFDAELTFAWDGQKISINGEHHGDTTDEAYLKWKEAS